MRWKRAFFPSLMFFLNTSGLPPAPTAEHETVVMPPLHFPLKPSPFKWFIHLFALPCIFGPTAEGCVFFFFKLLLALNMETTTTAPIFIHVVLQKYTICFDVLLFPYFPLQQKTQRTFSSDKESY